MSAMSSEMIITFSGGKKVDATFGGFTIKTDQPTRFGGDGTAPEPFTLFLASIGTCAGIFVLSFCQRRQIPTDAIRLIQTHHYDETGHGIDRIDIAIEIPRDFPEKYRDALINAANLCAVKQHIADPPEFIVRTVAAGEQ